MAVAAYNDSAEDWWAEVAFKMQARREADAPLFRHMVQVRDRYNAPDSIAMPDVEGEPEIAAPVPMILADAIDSLAMRAATVTPGIVVPALDRTKPRGQRSLEYASIRKDALQASWYTNGVTDLMLPRAYRHFGGYGTWNMCVMPDFDRQMARIELKDPLGAYPEVRSPEDTRPPVDCGYVYGRSATWLARNYPETRRWIADSGCREDALWDVVEWVDPEWVAIGVIGPRKVAASGAVWWAGTHTPNINGYQNGMLLRRWPNKAGVTPVGTPRRATLDQIFGQVAQMVPIADLYGKLAALSYIAAEKEVFPSIALMGNQIGRTPTLEGGEWKDGRTGEINTVYDGEAKVVSAAPGPMTRAALADIERAIRLSTGQSELNSGMLSGSVRSGNTVSAINALSSDPRIMEAHNHTARALVHVNEAVLATEAGYWPDKKYYVFAGGTNDGIVEYTPSKHFEGTWTNGVTYGKLAGYDSAQASLALLQLSSSELESKRAIQHMHPLIEDPERAQREIDFEQTIGAIKAAFGQHILDGTTPLIDAIAFARALRDGGDVLDAIEKADTKSRERQAALAPPPGPDQALSPEATPGLASPGQGAEQPQTVPGPNASQTNLEQLLYTLGQPARSVR